MKVNEFKKAVGDKIRGHLGTEDKFVTDEIPAKIDEVYAAGQASGGGSSDPAAEAVMALMKRASSETVLISDYGGVVGRVTYTVENYNGGADMVFMIVPECVTAIGEDALPQGSSGNNTEIILCLPTTPPKTEWQGGWSANGGNMPPKAIYVPDESVDAYKAAENWSEFADIIKPMSMIGYETLPAGWYAFGDSPQRPADFEVAIKGNHPMYGINFTALRVRSVSESEWYIEAILENGSVFEYCAVHTEYGYAWPGYGEESDREIVITEDTIVSEAFYNWFMLNTNH